jgi:RHS repeat-associated protein
VQKITGTGRLAQSVAYAYNIRGWLTSLNNPYAPAAGALFGLSLHYERGFTPTYEQYNGNLTGQTWRGRDGVQRAYGYVYDPASRLLQGDFVARTGGAANPGGAWTAEEDRYRLAFASYDDNGNLLTLRRRGLLASATRTTARQYGPVDELTYRYQGNRLHAVADQVTTNQLTRPTGYGGAPASLAGDFQEGGTRLGQEYLYDANGSLTQDHNKGISAIAYNHLSLPTRIRFGQGADSLVFRYTAAGQKVAKLVYQTGKPVQRTDYLSGYQYEQDSLRFFPHAEGRVLRSVNTTSGAVRYEREYTFKDHLGNLRLAYRLGQVRTYAASLEQDAPTHRREAQQFDSLSVSPPVAQPVGARARSGSYAAKLNAGGAAPQPLGPLKQLAVQQGDTVTITAPGLYPQAVQRSFWFSLASFLTGLLQPAPSLPAPPDAVRRGGLPLLQVGVAAGLASVQQLSGGVPKGYVRLLVFDADSNLVSQQTQQLSAAALNNYESLRLQVVVPQDGYVTAYVGNESNVDVFFDDVTVEHRQGLQVQENQYDPWGLSLTGLDYTSPATRHPNNQQFNGKEQERELGLNWQDFNWRHYDPATARFFSVDRLAEKFVYLTPYQFASNDPVGKIELDGMEGVPVILFHQSYVAPAMEKMSKAIEKAYNSISAKMEFGVTIGPQAGVKLGNSELDVTVGSAKVFSENVSLQKGKLTVEGQALTDKMTVDAKSAKSEKAGVEVENKFGIKLGGIGYEFGQVQDIGSDLVSSNSRTYQKTSIYKGDGSVTFTKETSSDGTVKVSGENSYSIGAKFILGLEVKISKTSSSDDQQKK